MRFLLFRDSAETKASRSQPARSQPEGSSRDGRPRWKETILVLEDEEVIRDFAMVVLEQAGYRVLGAATGEEAIAMASDPAHGRIQLLLADVVLPGIDGTEAAKRIQSLHPATRVLFTSGYGEDVLARHHTPITQTGFLQKPYAPAALLGKVQRLLDRPFVVVARQELARERAAIAALESDIPARRSA